MSKLNILITGASSGIGEALAIYYAKKGAATLFLCGRDKERLNKVKVRCEKLGTKTYSQILDVSNNPQTTKWVNDCEQIAPLNLIIANAGVSTANETPENIFNTFNININGVLNTIIPSIEILKQREDKKKQIAIISSIAGYHGLPSCPSYSASKTCVKAYGEALRPALRHYNIKVNVVCPGFIRSRITDRNTCPMPFFMEADKAAEKIAKGLKRNTGLIAFPLPMRFASWLISILPNSVSDFVYSKLPHKA